MKQYKHRKWTENEIEKLISLSNSKTNEELSVIFGASPRQIQYRINKIIGARKTGYRSKKITYKENLVHKHLGSCYECTSHSFLRGGYPAIKRNGKSNNLCRVIYEEKYGKIPKGLVLRHKCDNPPCINVNHLEIGTHQDNIKDRVERNRSARGEKNGFAKLTAESVIEILKKLKRGISCIALAKEYEVTDVTIGNIKLKKTWRHVNLGDNQ